MFRIKNLKYLQNIQLDNYSVGKKWERFTIRNRSTDHAVLTVHMAFACMLSAMSLTIAGPYCSIIPLHWNERKSLWKHIKWYTVHIRGLCNYYILHYMNCMYISWAVRIYGDACIYGDTCIYRDACIYVVDGYLLSDIAGEEVTDFLNGVHHLLLSGVLLQQRLKVIQNHLTDVTALVTRLQRLLNYKIDNNTIERTTQYSYQVKHQPWIWPNCGPLTHT